MILIPGRWVPFVMLVCASLYAFIWMPIFTTNLNDTGDELALERKFKNEGVITFARVINVECLGECSEDEAYVTYDYKVGEEFYSGNQESISGYSGEQEVKVLYLPDNPSEHRLVDHPAEEEHNELVALFFGVVWALFPGIIFRPYRNYMELSSREADLYHIRVALIPSLTIASLLMIFEKSSYLLPFLVGYLFVILIIGIPWLDIRRIRQTKSPAKPAIIKLIVGDFAFTIYLAIFVACILFIPALQEIPIRLTFSGIALIGMLWAGKVWKKLLIGLLS